MTAPPLSFSSQQALTPRPDFDFSAHQHLSLTDQRVSGPESDFDFGFNQTSPLQLVQRCTAQPPWAPLSLEISVTTASPFDFMFV